MASALVIDLTTDLAKAEAWSAAMRKQLPFAVSKALNDTAFDIRGNTLPGATRQFFNQPTPFIQKGWRVDRSSKANLTVTIGAESQRVRIIRRQIEGGQRVNKPFELRIGIGKLVPGAGVKLNTYGNVPLSTIKRITAGLGPGGQFFIAQPNNPQGIGPGVYKRVKGGLSPQFIGIDSATYSPRFKLLDVVGKAYERRYGDYFKTALEQALATAR